MKRRAFVQMLGAVALMPRLPLTAFPATASPALSLSTNYTPFMQANALAILRHHETLSFEAFLSKTGLNPAQAEAMLVRFAKSGWISRDGLASIHASKPQWMKDFCKPRQAVDHAANTSKARYSSRGNENPPPDFSAPHFCLDPDCANNLQRQNSGNVIERHSLNI